MIMGHYGTIDFDEEEIDAAGHWYGGQGSMLYAILSTGALSRGTIRPRNHDGSPMTDEEWMIDLAERLESEAEDAARDAKKQAKKAKGETRAELKKDIEGLSSIAFKAGQYVREAKRGQKTSHARKKSSAQLQRDINEVLAKPVTASKKTSVLPPSVRVARAGLESVRKHGIKNLRYGLYRHTGDRAYQWGNFTGTPEHVITAVVPNDKNVSTQEALVRALKWKR